MRLKDEYSPFSYALVLLVVGAIMGTIFTVGQAFWNETVTREECTYVETCLLDYEIDYQGIDAITHSDVIRGISIDCSNGERYFVDRECIHSALEVQLERLEENAEITLLIHPNSHKIVEFIAEDEYLLRFETCMDLLYEEKINFLPLGIVCYAGAALGLGYTVWLLLTKKRCP